MLIDNIFLTDADIDITLYSGSPTWDSKSVRVDENSNAAGHWKRGLDTDTWLIILAPRLKNDVTGETFPDKISGTPWIEAARQGVFDGADVQIDRAYFSAWPVPYTGRPGVPVGVITIFAGRVAEVDVTDTIVALTINDYRELLTQKIPPNIYGAPCYHTLFDAGCRLQEANFQVTGSIASGSTRTVLQTTAVVPGGSGTFALGKIRMTSGLNNGFSRTIRTWTAPDEIGILNPFPFALVIGDTFNVYPGCNKTKDTCTAFGNLDNFGGFPDIPDSSAAL